MSLESRVEKLEHAGADVDEPMTLADFAGFAVRFAGSPFSSAMPTANDERIARMICAAIPPSVIK